MKIKHEQLTNLANQYGDSFFIYSSEKLSDNIKSFKVAFSESYKPVVISYSYKTNYAPAVLNTMRNNGVWAEVVSEMEFDLAKKIGNPFNQIIVNGPVKPDTLLVKALNSGALINIDSIDELQRVIRISDEIGTQKKQFKVGIRCNFGLINSEVSRFGIATSSVDFAFAVKLIDNSMYLILSGLHCHLPHRELGSFQIRIKKLIELAKKTFINPPEFLDIGGGFLGTDLPTDNDRKKTPTFSEYADVISEELVRAYPDPTLRPKLILEPGTALVANTFTYWTKVIARKNFKNMNILIVDGSVYEMSPNKRKDRLPSEHIFSNKEPRGGALNWQIAGYTCIEDDYLSREFEEAVCIGDFLAYSHAGSYSIVMKPPFIRLASAILELDDNYNIKNLIRRKQTLEDLVTGFE